MTRMTRDEIHLAVRSALLVHTIDLSLGVVLDMLWEYDKLIWDEAVHAKKEVMAVCDLLNAHLRTIEPDQPIAEGIAEEIEEACALRPDLRQRADFEIPVQVSVD